MKVRTLIFTDSIDELSQYPFFSEQRNAVEFYNFGLLRKILRGVSETVIVYLDLNLRNEYEREIVYLSKKGGIFWGIIDPKGVVESIGGLFLRGCVDYIGEFELTTENFSVRSRRVINYIKKYRKESEILIAQNSSAKVSTHEYVPVSWEKIKEGKEYTFSVMFVELDGKSEMEGTWGKSNLDIAVSRFYSFIKNSVTPYDGRIWMWSGFSGIVLFPFNGREILSALCGFRLKIFKYIFDVEDSLFPDFVSFRLALHLGNMTYARVGKGHVISDCINSVVHLGKRFAKPNSFCITENIYNFLHRELLEYFGFSGNFEGRDIYEMRLPYF